MTCEMNQYRDLGHQAGIKGGAIELAIPAADDVEGLRRFSRYLQGYAAGATDRFTVAIHAEIDGYNRTVNGGAK